MTPRILTLREINRATLSRQLLLERANLSVPSALERLVGLQAQQPIAPYIGLWTRLQNFTRDDLASLIENRVVVKATLMRATLHLATTDDYLNMRATLQPTLTAAYENIVRERKATFKLDDIVAEAREFFTEAPRSFAELSKMLHEAHPDQDVGAMRYSVRTHLPLIQVPIKDRWSYPGNPKFTPADQWLGKAIPTQADLPALIKRYLAAFGPAAVKDMQTWSGLGNLKEAFEELRPELVTYRDEKKRELFDLPDMPIPDGDTPAPPRFLPEYDNTLLSYEKRTRIRADEHRKKIYLPGLRVASTILIDGFVAGAWKIERKKKEAALTITPFVTLTKQDRAALTEEGEKLLKFVETDSSPFKVRFEA